MSERSSISNGVVKAQAVRAATIRTKVNLGKFSSQAGRVYDRVEDLLCPEISMKGINSQIS